MAGEHEALAVEVGRGRPGAGVLDLHGARVEVEDILGVVVGVEARPDGHLLDVADGPLDLAHAGLGPGQGVGVRHKGPSHFVFPGLLAEMGRGPIRKRPAVPGGDGRPRGQAWLGAGACPGGPGSPEVGQAQRDQRQGAQHQQGQIGGLGENGHGEVLFFQGLKSADVGQAQRDQRQGAQHQQGQIGGLGENGHGEVLFFQGLKSADVGQAQRDHRQSGQGEQGKVGGLGEQGGHLQVLLGSASGVNSV